MKYLLILGLLIISINPVSYAKYNWSNKNWLGAAGMMLLAILSIFMPIAFMFIR